MTFLIKLKNFEKSVMSFVKQLSKLCESENALFLKTGVKIK